MTQDGIIRIQRSIGGSGAAFQVTFTPYNAEEEAGGVRRFHELQQVREFLRVLGIGADFIREALRQLAAGRSASVSDVRLTDKVARRAGFLSTENLARSVG
ncbi:MAG: hypothetical protein LAN61_12820 [Acidobacteriia bacterium]|jgi:hypothetical protein|nr:hypothetical protein [Terriglobia bacterium]